MSGQEFNPETQDIVLECLATNILVDYLAWKLLEVRLKWIGSIFSQQTK
jgi:hypothetical protein